MPGMGYAESKRWLYSLKFAMKGFTLRNIERLLELAELDVSALKTIHVAGSNGKGSVCAFISSVLSEQGYKTGLYTSPHLIEPLERIKINGREISRAEFAALASHFKALMEENNVSANFFEAITAMALKYFIDEKADFLVAEVGMGGRLDATNVLHGIVCVITSISHEHTQYLGKTIEKISAEKAGIIKKGSIVVVAENNAGKKIIFEKAAELNCAVVEAKWETVFSGRDGQEFNLASPEKIAGIKIKMLGAHQIENAATAAAALGALRGKGFRVSDESLRKGLEKTLWSGRLQKVQEKPLVILDCAHNPDGWKKLFEALKIFEYDKMFVVFGAMNDKRISVEFRKFMGKNADALILTKSDSFRAEEPENLREKIGFGVSEKKPEKAFARTLKKAGPKDLVLITGSIYLVGKACEFFGVKA